MSLYYSEFHRISTLQEKNNENLNYNNQVSWKLFQIALESFIDTKSLLVVNSIFPFGLFLHFCRYINFIWQLQIVLRMIFTELFLLHLSSHICRHSWKKHKVMLSSGKKLSPWNTTNMPLGSWKWQNKAVWFLIGWKEIGEDLRIYSVRQPLNLHVIFLKS